MNLDQLLAVKARTPKPKTYCLCGSTNRAAAAFQSEGFRLTLAGYKVLSIGVNARDADLNISKEQKELLDVLHLFKVEDADVVRILNVGGYIGESTRREWEYAQRLGKQMEFLEEPKIESFPVPVMALPMFEAALGYNGDAWLMGCYFSGDHAYYTDGLVSPAAEKDAYTLLVNHPVFAEHLDRFTLGVPGVPPSHYLLLDRQSRMFFVAPVAESVHLLRQQWELQEVAGPEVTQGELDVLRDDLLIHLSQVPSTRVALERSLAHQCQVAELRGWLAKALEEVYQ